MVCFFYLFAFVLINRLIELINKNIPVRNKTKFPENKDTPKNPNIGSTPTPIPARAN